MKTYKGVRAERSPASVYVVQEGKDKLLDAHEPLWTFGHEPFTWGGSASPGQRQLALALLVDATDSAELALHLAEHFASAVLSQLPEAGFELAQGVIRDWVLRQYENDLLDARLDAEKGGPTHGK